MTTQRRMTRVEQREQTRERLLQAASELFAERGVNGASIEEITERAGYSRGAFYSNYADKHDLVMALLAHRTEREYEEVLALGATSESTERTEALRAWHRERGQHAASWLSLRTELWLYALREGQDALLAQIAARERFARDALAGGLARAFTEAGVTPPAEIATLALILHALEDGLLIQRQICPDGMRDETIVDAADLLIRSWIALARANDAGDTNEVDPSP